MEYVIHRDSLGRTAVCACGGMDCAVTSYVYPADRAYRYDGPCTAEGHTAPVEVPLEIAEAGTSDEGGETMRCAQVGPRGGKCRRKAERGSGGRPLDFCGHHNRMVRAGHTVWCSRCDNWAPSRLEMKGGANG